MKQKQAGTFTGIGVKLTDEPQPRIVERVMATVYRIVKAPHFRERAAALEWARERAVEHNRLVCVTFEEGDCVYFKPDGGSYPAESGFRGGFWFREE